MLLLYNLLMLAVDVAAIVALARSTSLRGRLGILAGVAFVSLFLAAATGEGIFGQMRLISCGLFIHGVILAAALAFLSWQQRSRIAVAWLGLAVMLAAIGIDAFFIEPYWLETTRLTLHSAKVDHSLRVVVIADFQTDTIGDFERDVLATALAEKPDLILLAGDYIQVAPREWPRLVTEFRQLLAQSGLNAPLGIYAVKGNIDPDAWQELFEDSSVHVFAETSGMDVGGVHITGLSQPDSLNPRLQLAPAESFHIVVGHHPDYALSDIEADLMIAGHTHGGQVRLPIIGPLLTLTRVPRSWAAGVTERAPGRTLVVSRGTGLERGSAPRLRFLCRPELVVIQIEPAAAPSAVAGE